MPLWIKGPEQPNIVEELGVRFRSTAMHGPFGSVLEAAEYWRKVSGAPAGEEVPPFWDEPELIELDLPTREEDMPE